MIFGLILWPIICFAIGGAGAYMLGRAGFRRMGWLLVALIALAACSLIAAGRAAQGMEGLGYVALSLFFFAPGAVGAVTGLMLGLRRFHRGHEK